MVETKLNHFAFEGTKREFAKHMKTIDNLTDKKVNLFEEENTKGGLLDESQIREEE